MKRAFRSAGLGILAVAVVGLGRRAAPLFSANYLPHRFCYLAQPGLIWTNVVTDGLIAASYAAIFGCLIWIAAKLRRVDGFRDYLWIFVSFGLFIAACGLTHVMEVVTVWLPVYPLAAAMKVLCALASVPTAVMLVRVTPLLMRRIPHVMDSLMTTQAERDEARAELAMAQEVLRRARDKDAELQAANDLLNHVLDSTSEGITKVGLNWKLQYANRRALERWPELVIGKSFWEIFPALVSSESEWKYRGAMDGRREIQFDDFYAPYNEWFRINIHPTPGGISIFYMPITLEKTLEQQIVKERAIAYEQINSVMDSTAEGILKVGKDWTILYGNRVAREILPDLVIGKCYWDCFPATRATESEGHLREAMSGEKRVEWESFYAPYQEYYAVHAYPTEGGISLFFIPITQRKKLEQQLATEQHLREKRIEALSVMAGGLAHEISNPLAIIHGTASDLLRSAMSHGPLDVSEVKKASESIVSTAERANRILRGLRGFAREAGNDPMEYASIYEIVEQSVQMQETRFERHAVDLRVDLAPGIPLLLCRETQVGQIVTNLVNNAFDAITQQECTERWVEVRARVDGDCVQVDVLDSGFGIEESARQRLMEPFFSTKTRGLGMGVGLSLSRAIANEHGGTLVLCESTERTCFRLMLPIHAAESSGLALTETALDTAEAKDAA